MYPESKIEIAEPRVEVQIAPTTQAPTQTVQVPRVNTVQVPRVNLEKRTNSQTPNYISQDNDNDDEQHTNIHEHQ